MWPFPEATCTLTYAFYDGTVTGSYLPVFCWGLHPESSFLAQFLAEAGQEWHPTRWPVGQPPGEGPSSPPVSWLCCKMDGSASSAVSLAPLCHHDKIPFKFQE